MRNLNVKSKTNLIRVKLLLVESMKLLNNISEEDFKEVVLFSQKQKKILENIQKSVFRGNLFMILFFYRELIEEILNKD